ncbi:DUF4330 family protein [Haloplanus salinus]|uniref:DUF4330 family protein n=1 Tax=Haloplanus salinus TaxID=1126245 RepID=A0A368NA95_9EURY|nr:DUF4330 family protein [Haloplanus salinus]RCU46444.1 DUF4330 family protein [Haloplanus salinus]
MALIDSEGNIFGRINIVDAVAVFLAVAIVVAGATFVLLDDPSQTTSGTRYVTVDLGTQPNYVATLVSEGDTTVDTTGANVTITDVYTTASGSDRRVRVRARITAPMDGETVTYAGAPLRVGRNVELVTEEYTTSGTITAVENENPNLPTEPIDVLLRTELTTETANDIERGQVFRIDGRNVATIQSVSAYRSGSDTTVAYVGITYQTYRSADGPQFGGTAIRHGATIPMETDLYAFEGEVARVGALTPVGQTATRTVSLKMENVDPDLSSSLGVGLTERVRGETVARLTDVTVTPATVVLTSQDGNVYQRQHPVQKDVTMTAELRVRETSTGVRFKGSALRQGRTVVLDFGTVTVEATVTRG